MKIEHWTFFILFYCTVVRECERKWTWSVQLFSFIFALRRLNVEDFSTDPYYSHLHTTTSRTFSCLIKLPLRFFYPSQLFSILAEWYMCTYRCATEQRMTQSKWGKIDREFRVQKFSVYTVSNISCNSNNIRESATELSGSTHLGFIEKEKQKPKNREA